MTCVRAPGAGGDRQRLRAGGRRRRRAARALPRPGRRSWSWTATCPVLRDVDVILYDTFGQVQGDGVDVDSLVDGGTAKVVDLQLEPPRRAGARTRSRRARRATSPRGWRPRSSCGAIERIHAGEIGSCPSSGGTANPKPESDWPGQGARADRPRGGDHRPDHPGALQPGDRRAQLPEHQLGQDLHPHGLPQDRRRAPRAGGAVGDQARLRTGRPAPRPAVGRDTQSLAAPAPPSTHAGGGTSARKTPSLPAHWHRAIARPGRRWHPPGIGRHALSDRHGTAALRVIRPGRLPANREHGTHPDSYLECMREQTRVLTVLAAVVAGAVLAMAPPASARTTTTTTLVSSANPSTVGQAVTLTSTVTGSTPRPARLTSSTPAPPSAARP